VYAGHAAIALYAKRVRPTLPVALLVPVAFAPDWIQWILAELGRQNPSLSHSLLSVVAGATIVAGIYRLAGRPMGDASVLWLTYLSHWPADFITAAKAIWPGSREFGLNLYSHPALDGTLEAMVVLLCWIAYRRSLSVEARRKAIGWAIPVGLVALQIAFELIQDPSIRDPLRQVIPG